MIPVKDYPLGTKFRTRDGREVTLVSFEAGGVAKLGDSTRVWADTGRGTRNGEMACDVVTVLAPPELLIKDLVEGQPCICRDGSVALFVEYVPSQILRLAIFSDVHGQKFTAHCSTGRINAQLGDDEKDIVCVCAFNLNCIGARKDKRYIRRNGRIATVDFASTKDNRVTFKEGYEVQLRTGKNGDSRFDIVAEYPDYYLTGPNSHSVPLKPAEPEEIAIPWQLDEIKVLPDLEKDVETKVQNLSLQAQYKLQEVRELLINICEAKDLETAELVQLGLIRTLSEEIALED